jgi:hypothetical protein
VTWKSPEGVGIAVLQDQNQLYIALAKKHKSIRFRETDSRKTGY